MKLGTIVAVIVLCVIANFAYARMSDGGYVGGGGRGEDPVDEVMRPNGLGADWNRSAYERGPAQKHESGIVGEWFDKARHAGEPDRRGGSRR
jgi:hypothetical protein